MRGRGSQKQKEERVGRWATFLKWKKAVLAMCLMVEGEGLIKRDTEVMDLGGREHSGAGLRKWV